MLISRVKETVNSVPGQAIPGYSVGAKLAAGGRVSQHVSRNPIQELPHLDSADSSSTASTYPTKTEQVMFDKRLIQPCLYERLCFREFSCSQGLQEKQLLLTHIFSRRLQQHLFTFKMWCSTNMTVFQWRYRTSSIVAYFASIESPVWVDKSSLSTIACHPSNYRTRFMRFFLRRKTTVLIPIKKNFFGRFVYFETSGGKIIKPSIRKGHLRQFWDHLRQQTVLLLRQRFPCAFLTASNFPSSE